MTTKPIRFESKQRRLIPFHRAPVGTAEAQAVAKAVLSGWLTMGPATVDFENAFAAYVGVKHSIAVSSCTAALHLALEAIGVQPGDEVLVPTLTFAATAEVVIYLQARPILVDSDPAYFNMSPDDAAKKVTTKARAIIPVHFAGHPCDMDSLLDLARDRELSVIEDAAHALPARYRETMVGGIGRATAFSFYATKTLTTGEGGMVTTNDDAIAERVRLMRLHGMSRDAWKRYSDEGSWRYDIHEAGFKYNFTDPQAALGLVQLAKCNALRERRGEIAAQYSAGLALLDSYRTPRVADAVQTAWHLYYILVEEETLRIARDQVIRELQKRGVQTSVHFIPLHLHSYYRSRYGCKPGDYPVAEDYARRCISLPIYPDMSNEEVEYVIGCLEEISQGFRR